jgi:ABC-type antimicrobial peptide transport system permease subunit
MYLIGTAVSIALAMTLFIIFYIKLGPVYPEYNRHRMVVIENASQKIKNQRGGYLIRNSNISRSFAKLIKDEAKSIERMALQSRVKCTVVNTENNKKTTEYLNIVNGDFWQVFDYKFVEGHPFSEQQSESAERVVVISTTLAQQLFAETKVVGKTLNIYGVNYKITAVVEPASGCTPITEGNLWHPIYWRSDDNEFVGFYKAYIIGEETEKIKAEIDDVFNRYVQAQPKENIYTMEVEDYWQNALDCDGETTLLDAIGKYLYILLAFLFIPALNLSGMISSRMESRLDEIGVRKAYGATNGQIISQVLWENLLLTLMGTIIGLILAYVVVITGSSWITAFFDARINEVTPREINADMLLNPTVIICTLSLSLLLNISSALLPTVIALKKDIVQSLYQRR